MRSPSLYFGMVILAASAALLHAGDLRINIPKHSEATPVQKLNREGVKEIQKHNLGKAEKLFYRAYLIDPDDPFTLNNLGYALEGQGNLDEALRYYNDASLTHSTEPVVVALDSRWRGKPISDIAFRNEQAVRQRLASEQSNQDRAARLNVEGVSALNH